MKRLWVWCSLCRRCYERNVPIQTVERGMLEEIEQAGGLALYCEYDDCAGTFVDAIPWVEVHREYPKYPTVPEIGNVYPADTDLLVV